MATPVRHKVIFSIGVTIGFLCFLVLLGTLYQKITSGEGVFAYRSGHGVGRNYIGTAVTVGVAVLIGVAAGAAGVVKAVLRRWRKSSIRLDDEAGENGLRRR